MQHLLNLCDTYIRSKGISASYIGILILNNSKFFSRIEKGGSCTIKTYNKVLQWFSDHWPDGLEWPADCERPTPNPVALKPTPSPSNQPAAAGGALYPPLGEPAAMLAAAARQTPAPGSFLSPTAANTPYALNAFALNERGEIKNARAFCDALGVTRNNYDKAVAHLKAKKRMPGGTTAKFKVIAALGEAGDSRVPEKYKLAIQTQAFLTQNQPHPQPRKNIA